MSDWSLVSSTNPLRGALSLSISTCGTRASKPSRAPRRSILRSIASSRNILHFSLERSPILQFASATLRADLAAGGALRAEALGKIAGGLTMLGTGIYLANAGIITGGGPVDNVLRRNKIELEGWRPYSIRIGDTYYSYDHLSPLGSLLGALADYAEIGGQIQPYKADELIQAMALAVSRSLTSANFLQGYADFLSAATGDAKSFSRLGKSLTTAAFTPEMLRAIKREIDPLQRDTEPGADPENGSWQEVRRYINTLKAQTPGFSFQLPPRRNLWGDPIEVPSGWGPDMLSPVYTSTRKNDPADDEIVRLGRMGLTSVGRAPRVILGQDPESLPFGRVPTPLMTGIELTDQEYDDFVKLAGNEWKDSDGLGLHERLNQTILTDQEYREASDALKGMIITRMVNTYRRGAIGELLQRHQGLGEVWQGRLEGKADALSAPAATSGRAPQITITPR